MTPDDKKKILRALKVWVEHHPSPDRPVIDIGLLLLLPTSPDSESGGTLSPRQIYNEIREDSELGNWLIRVLESGIEKEGLDCLLDGFAKK